jgi:enolase-phosphatase E1
MIRAIVTDIEGTTSSISFVKDVLFPYARAQMPEFVKKNEKKIGQQLDEIRALEGKPQMTTEAVIDVLIRLIDSDSKVTALKALQGMIWEDGYKKEAFQGHIYNDALEGLQRWHEQGIALYIYSSGSVPAQKLLFGNTQYGNLNGLFSGYFDTTTGGKLEVESYKKIAKSIGMPAGDVLFLSDNEKEIDAAHKAGMETVLVTREGELNPNYKTVKNFHNIVIQEKAA